MTDLLELRSVTASYGSVTVLHGVDLSVPDGAVVLLLGANGAGKTTTLRAISGSVASKGEIRLAGESIRGVGPDRVARRGVAHVPQGRGTFAELSVEDNLLVGAYLRRDQHTVKEDLATWYERFPRLAERRSQPAGLLSGGEQQMLAIARAMMSRPRLLMLDEPSLGLAPKVVHALFELLRDINTDHGTSMLIVEQNAELALTFADSGSVLEVGRTALSGRATELAGNAAVRDAYLGTGGHR